VVVLKELPVSAFVVCVFVTIVGIFLGSVIC
jgi:hypothetical protein